jgi:hypothetical protein
MKTRTPLKRTRLRRTSRKRAKHDDEYRVLRTIYLSAHPLDQYALAQLGFDEEEVLQAFFRGTAGVGSWFLWRGQHIPPSNQVHHRNQRHGARLIDVRWFLAVSNHTHDMINNNLRLAREQGFSLPIQADANGFYGSGQRGLTTPELMRSKIRP